MTNAKLKLLTCTEHTSVDSWGDQKVCDAVAGPRQGKSGGIGPVDRSLQK
jgi:hypothetical protein